MDPEATLARLAAAIDEGNASEAVQALGDYYRWRIKGGNQPQHCGTLGLAGDEYAELLAAQLADMLE
jgi:hypothetical protein